MTAIVKVDGLSKRYRIGGPAERYGRLTESLTEWIRSPLRKFRGRRRPHIWALRNLSMQISEGEVAGIIGRNGAGKTTLLKILSRITEPTEGKAELHGRVGSLLEVGTGFHPELTGGENIFLNGAILGMKRSEIKRKFDEIVDFAEVAKFIETPVKRYSSGMQVRLAFSVAAHLEPEILIVDEVLAVGDTSFQRKCLGKMSDVATSGRTVLFVSHNMAAVESLCTRAYLLNHGELVSEGDVVDVVDEYLSIIREAQPEILVTRSDRQGNGKLRFEGISSDLKLGSEGTIRLRYAGEPPLRNVEITVGVFTLRGEGAVFLGNLLSGHTFDEISARGEIVCTFDRTPLLPGSYLINVYCTVNGILADWIIDAARLEVAEGDFFGSGRTPLPGYGTVAVPHRWRVDSE